MSTSSPGEPEPAAIAERGPIVKPAAIMEPGPIVGPAASQRPSSGPVLPEQSREDTDAGWGEYPVTDDQRTDERLCRDRPPHWDDS